MSEDYVDNINCAIRKARVKMSRHYRAKVEVPNDFVLL